MDTVDTTEQRPQRRRRGILVFLLMVTSLATVGATAMSLALFTDDDATAGAFSTGTVNIALTDTTTVFDVPAMMPGDVEYADLNVANSGTADFRYAMSSTATDPDDLGGQIVLTIYEGTCALPGDEVWTGALDVAGFGDATPGDDLGDRFLAAGTEEDFCFKAELPDSTINDYQDTSVSVEFTFDAEQTANNP